MILEQPYGHWRKAPHDPTRPNHTLDFSRRQSERTCKNLIRQCAYGTIVWRDKKGSITSQPRTISSCMVQHLTPRPCLKKAIYPHFANLDGMSVAIIMNIPLFFPTTVKSLDRSWAPLEAKEMKWPNGLSRPMDVLCQGDHYDH